MAKLVIIDGNAILHRAYHALPPLTNSQGMQINAVYGFISMLFKIKEGLQPTHLLVCFDRPEPTFRKQMYVGYQAKRPKMDDELSIQIDLVKQAVSSMHVPIYELAGYEADDIIGSLVFQAKNLKVKSQKEKVKINEVVIVTGDRDILQLIDETVKVYMPIQGLTLAKLYGEKEVEEKFGVKPSQIIDYKALVGDASDNYPGVKGIGPKTASALLQKYHTFEQIYQAIKENDTPGISEKIAKALSEEVNEAEMAKKLATITTDVPVTLDIAKTEITTFNTLDAQVFFEQMGFKTLMRRLTGEKKTVGKQVVKEDKNKPPTQQLSLV